MELDILIPVFALTIQLISLFCAIRLVRYTENRIIGIVFVLVICLMSFRRALSLFRFFFDGTIAIDMLAELIALVISVLILCGIILIARYFKLVAENKRAAAYTETLYRTLFDQSPDGVLLMNMQGELLEFNDAAHRQLGYMRDEFKTLRISDLDPVESSAEIQARFEKILQAGKDQFEVKHITKQRDVRDVLIIAQTIELNGEILFHAIWRDITESRQAEGKLTSIMKAVESASDAIGIADAQGHHFYQNKAFSDLFGFATAEELEAAGGESVVVHDPEVAQEMFAHIMQGKSWVGELAMVTKSGRVFPAFERADAVTDHDGKLIGLIGIISDITEHKNAEEALRESEERFRTLLNSLDALVYVADMATHEILFINEYGQKIWGKVVGKTCWQALQTGQTGPCEFCTNAKLLTDNGEPAGSYVWEFQNTVDREWYECRDQAIRWPDGRYVRMEIATNITQRQQTKDKLRKSEEFIRNILDTVEEGFIVVDREYRILTANSAYCNQMGDCAEKIIGRHCYEVSHKTDQPCHGQGEECAILQVFETGRPHTTLHRHTDAEGNILYVEIKGYPLKDQFGTVTSVIETINNITEKHLLEEERLKTQKLESIGTLAGGIAHDFNNLLQGVFGFISLAKESHDQKEKSLSMLEQAEKALHLSVNLTNQLLTFSKGGQPVKKLIRVTPVVENAVKFALSGSDTDYELNAEAGLWPVEADEGQLVQVIQNIVLNANQAMADGGTVRVTLSNADIAQETLASLPDGGQFIRIAIQDSGMGIDKQDLARIFDPYFTTKQKGHGLGLATSYSIIKNHGGMIEVKSGVNRGTTFTVYIPAAKDVETDITSTIPNATGTKKGRILLMDDEELIRDVSKAMISLLGHDIVCAKDGLEAIALFREAKAAGVPFNLVILDLTVKGGMGGEEAIREIREIDPEVNAVVSSGYADSPVVANYREYGFSAVLNKPYELTVLNKCLNQYIQV